MSYQLSFTQLVDYNAEQPSITVPVTLSVSQLGRRGFIEQTTLGLVDYEGKLYLGRYHD